MGGLVLVVGAGSLTAAVFLRSRFDRLSRLAVTIIIAVPSAALYGAVGWLAATDDGSPALAVMAAVSAGLLLFSAGERLERSRRSATFEG